MIELQYMALSGVAYDDMPENGIQDGSATRPWTIKDLAEEGKIDGFTINKSTGIATITDSALSALSTMQNWTLLDTDSDSSSGFAGMAFQAPDAPDGTPGEIVFAFRGTETNAGVADFIADSTIAFGNVVNGIPQQFQQAAAFVSQVRDAHPAASFSFTGHSLGGGIAQYMTYWMKEEESTDVAAVTFNAVGIAQKLPSNTDYTNMSLYPVTDYVNENDIIVAHSVCSSVTVYI